jgi:hypothetical protein
MKLPLSLFCGLLFVLSGIAQTQSSLNRLPAATINLKISDIPPLQPSAFRRFVVVDLRPDTQRIGIHTFVPTIGHPHNRQLVFRQSAAGEIAQYLNTRYARADAPYTALIVLRSLWLSDANYLREDRVKNPTIIFERTHIRLKAEVYAASDSGYMPVLRFDTLQSYVKSNQYDNLNSYYSLWDKDLAAVLDDMADSTSALAIAKAGRGRILRLDDILQFNHSRFDNAITSNATMTAGVYKSFDEFKNNAPSIQNFEIRTEKKNRVLYIKGEDGTSYYSHDAWGYCDGNNIYIMRDGMLYPAWREGQAFYFYSFAYKEKMAHAYGLYSVTDGPLAGQLNSDEPSASAPEPYNPVTTAANMTLTGAQRIAIMQQRIYTIDMDSGAVY